MDPAGCSEAFDGISGMIIVIGEGDDGAREKTHVIEDVCSCFANPESLVDVCESHVRLEKGRLHDDGTRPQYRKGI